MTSDSWKRQAAERALELVEGGMTLGLGTGSTAAHFVDLVGRKVKEGLKLRCVPTSEATRAQAERLGIPLITLDQQPYLDLTVDGADELDGDLRLIKGGGGALLREKVVAFTSAKFYCIVDEAKLVDKLYAFPLPLEVIPFAVKVVEREVAALGAQSTLRQKDGKTYVTDNGLWILDCRFPPIEDPPLLAKAFSSIPGIAEHGLFCGMVHELVVGTNNGVKVLKP